MKLFSSIGILSFAALLNLSPLTAQSAQADDNVPAADVPSVDDMVKALTIPPRTRSFRTKGLSGMMPELEKPTEAKLVFSDQKERGYFKVGKADLTESGRMALDHAAEAINTVTVTKGWNSPLQPQTFLITGHASQEGLYNFNMELSRKRAIAAKEYLQRTVRVPILIAWYGPNKPMPNTNPFDEKNRRFEVVNCGAQNSEQFLQCEQIIRSADNVTQ